MLPVTPSTLGDLRAFLLRHDAAPAPWSRADQVLEALYDLLRERRDDPVFWTDLQALVSRLEDRRVRRDEALSPDAIGALLAELRAALPRTAAPPARRWASRQSPGALLAFALLATALGCKDKDSGANDDSNGACTEATEHGFTGDEATVFCKLVEMVNESSLSAADKDVILECLPEMATADRENLLNSFEALSEEQLASELANLADTICYTYEDGGTH